MVEAMTEFDHTLYSVAKRLRAKYRNFVELEDVQQELWIWVITHGDKLEEWTDQHHPKSVQRLLSKALWNAGDKFCRREKARLTGYEVDDEFYYSLGMITDMLQLYFDEEWTAPRGLDLDKVSGGKPASEGWNLQVMVADVGKAYEALSPGDQALLRQVYGVGNPHDNIAGLALDLGITWNAADLRVRRVLGRIRAKLGGPRPYEEEE